MIVVEDRVVYPSEYRPSTFLNFEDTIAWWRSLAVLGALVALLAVAVVGDEGELAAIVGVVLFFATAVVAGQERYELGTALGTAGVVWTATGISLVLRTLGPNAVPALAFGAVGGLVLLLSLARAGRAGARAKRISKTDG